MTIVPREGGLQIKAYVANTDIGFVKIGQKVDVKIDAFPFTRYGTVQGEVINIASDAIDEQKAKRAQSNVIAAANSASMPSSSNPGQMQNFVFPITIALAHQDIKVDQKNVSLSAGMTVLVDIKTERRHMIDYILSPLARITSDALKER